ncbi:MAG: hypothetical protein PUG37_01045 [Bacillales bacterium]|nr:hypothetical protein [Bacillales bacterium]
MRILHFCFILSFILSPILEYNNQEILIENFEIIENDESFDICFTNKISVPFSMFKININKNFHESFKVDLGNNKISINKDYFIDINDFKIDWMISTGIEYTFNFTYIRKGISYLEEGVRYNISRINNLNASFVSLKDPRWIEFRRGNDYLYVKDSKLRLRSLGFFIRNNVDIKNIYLFVYKKHISYPYLLDEEENYKIPLKIGKDSYLHYVDSLSFDAFNEVFFSSKNPLQDELLFKKELKDQTFKIKLCICKTDIVTNNILFEFDLKVDKVIVYPSDIFKIRL